MKSELEQLFHCTILAFGEPTDDGERFEAVTVDGARVVADTLGLFISLLSYNPHQQVAA